ncbi:MAG: arylsulfatase A-like enzyme [Planctomycetota bacterium]|jgi:arylsulfatase A-like enzyme
MRVAATYLWGLLVLGLSACGEPAPPTPPRPDVAVVLIDTLRRDHLDLYGYERETAPYLRSLADQSAVFERAYSTSSWTAPATASVFTGLYPPRHGVTLGYNAYGRVDGEEESDEPAPELSKLPKDLATMSELFAEHGYQTFAVGSNLNVSKARGFARGFDRFESVIKAPAEDLQVSLARWAEERDPSQPSFWYLHFNDVHKPYTAREPWHEQISGGSRAPRDRYDSEIRALDEMLASLGASLGWGEDTIIVVIADHGEEFGDHGGKGHRYRLYGELMNVPMLWHVPGLTDQGTRLDVPVSLIDVLPTLADVLGFEDGQARDGRSLLPAMRGESLEQRPLFAQRRKPNHEPLLWAVVDGGWKLIFNDGTEQAELFNALEDPLDQVELSQQHPDQVLRLLKLLESIRAVQPLAADMLAPELDAAMIDHLTEMGYAGGDDEDDEDDED